MGSGPVDRVVEFAGVGSSSNSYLYSLYQDLGGKGRYNVLLSSEGWGVKYIDV